MENEYNFVSIGQYLKDYDNIVYTDNNNIYNSNAIINY